MRKSLSAPSNLVSVRFLPALLTAVFPRIGSASPAIVTPPSGVFIACGDPAKLACFRVFQPFLIEQIDFLRCHRIPPVNLARAELPGLLMVGRLPEPWLNYPVFFPACQAFSPDRITTQTPCGIVLPSRYSRAE